MLNAKLVIVGGDAKAGEVKLRLPTTVGRGKEASLTVPHALVSRRHAEIYEKEGVLVVKDLGSLNGTFVNNQRIESEVPLRPNQLLTVGNITFRAVYQLGPEAAPLFEEADTTEGKIGLETVHDADQTAPSKPLPKKPSLQKAVQKKSAAASAAVTADADDSRQDNSVLDSDDSSSSSKDTDKSLISSEVFALFDDEAKPDQSVSASAIDDLPTGPEQAASFVGKVDFGDDVNSNDQIDSVQIDLGEEKTSGVNDDDSSLGSFLNKLPK